MANYKLIPSRSFLKDLAKLPADVKPKVEEALLQLKNDPYKNRSIKKLTNVAVGAYRLRIGDFRLRYDIYGKEVHLHIIRHRKDIYRKK